jgi:hypothetical protein
LKETQNHLRFTEKLNNKKEGMYMNKTDKTKQGSYCPKEIGCCWNFFKKKKETVKA